MSNAPRDGNYIPSLIGKSDADNTPIVLEADPATKRLKVTAVVTSGAGGSQYTEDEPATADPVGTAVNLVRKDTPAAITTTDGDNIAQRGTNYGAAYAQIVTSTGTFVDTFGGGAQYTEGDTDASITGTALMFESGTDNIAVAGDGNPLPVTLNGTVAVQIQDTFAGTTGGGVEADALRVTVANDSTGVLSVDDNGSSLTVDNAALTELASAINSNLVDVNIVSGAGSGGTAAADDADFTAGTTQGTPSMGVYESTPTSVTDGDLGTVGITSGRRLKTSATIDAALPAGTNNIGDVDVLSSALPTGASTSAKQDTIIGHVDGIEGLLTTIDGDTGTIAGAVVGTEMQVDVVAALPAGNNNIGDVDVASSALPTGASTSANQTTIIGHLDGVEGLLTTIAGDTTDIETAVELIDDTVATLGTDTYTEAATKGLVIGAVRRDADTTLVGTTNEVAPLQVDANGRLKVEAFSGEALPVTLTSTTVTGTVAVTQSGTWDEIGINDSGNSITVDNGGTFATQVDGAALTALQLIDDTVYTDDTSTHATGTSKGTGIMAVAAPTDASVDANDIGMVAMTTARALKNDLTTIAGTAAVNGSGTATGALRVELPTNGTGVIATVGAVTAITNALPAGTNGIGKLTANSGVDIGDVDVTSISAGSNLVGDVGIQPRTTNGFDTFMASGSDGSSILVATAQAAKAAAGKVFGYYIYNPESAVTFVHFYNTAQGSVTVGTTNPLFTLPIPPTSAANLMSEIGITFGTAITVAATTTAGGNTAPATGVSLTLWYK